MLHRNATKTNCESWNLIGIGGWGTRGLGLVWQKFDNKIHFRVWCMHCLVESSQARTPACPARLWLGRWLIFPILPLYWCVIAVISAKCGVKFANVSFRGCWGVLLHVTDVTIACLTDSGSTPVPATNIDMIGYQETPKKVQMAMF